MVCTICAGRFFSNSSSIDNFFSDPELIFHILLQIFVPEQQAVTALPAAGCGVGNIPSGRLPAHLVALALHQRNEFLTAGGMAHAVVDEIHELQFFALATGGRVILADGHRLGLLFPVGGVEHRERKLHADLIVALPQFLELLLCDVQFLSRIEVDGVDEKVVE